MNNKNPLVSIIIPTFNRAHLISETLNSLIAQSYTNWECIVVDDSSTDKTSILLKEYCVKDSRFRYYQRPINKQKGANACRNYGFELSRGEYINWFDSDDLMLPHKLQIQLNMLHDSHYDYTICQTMMFDTKTNQELGLRAPQLISNNIFEDYVSYNIFWLTGAPLWKRKFIIKNKLVFDEELQQSQDYDFHIKALLVSQNFKTNETPLVIVKHHGENMSNSKNDDLKKVVSNVKVTNIILKKYRSKLTSITLYNKYKELLKFYKLSLKQKRNKASIIYLKSLIQNIDILEINIFRKSVFIAKLCLAFLSFLFISRGEGFLKFKI